MLRVSRVEKRAHQGAPDALALASWNHADRADGDNGVGADRRPTCCYVTDNLILGNRCERQLTDHVVRLPKRGEQTDLGWNTAGMIWALERLRVDELRSFVVDRFLPPHNHPADIRTGVLDRMRESARMPPDD